jgi:hypoxanthine phosphoribosyltransferase
MIRCTTPKITFNLKSVDMSLIDKIVVTFKQGDKILIKRMNDDITITGNTISFILKEEETKLLSPSKIVKFQVRCSTKTGLALATPIYQDLVYDVLNDEILNTSEVLNE